MSLLLKIVLLCGVLACSFVLKAESEADSKITVPSFELPVYSGLLSDETRQGLIKTKKENQNNSGKCPYGFRGADAETIIALRNCIDEKMSPDLDKRLQMHFDVQIIAKTIAGVPVEIFSPKNGVSPKNRRRILINLAGGAFVMTSKFSGRRESIPVSAMGDVEVISVNYRQGPENKFPSASEDVAAVYKELLKTYDPLSIGIYGCSSGGKLTAQSVAWFLNEGLPIPGAIGMFCSAGVSFPQGDSWYFNTTRGGPTPSFIKDSPTRHYYGDAKFDDPLVMPGRSDKILASFPPSLLISSTRDQFLSDVVYTHSRLVKLGVDTDLHVWEGIGHGGYLNPNIPEFYDAHDVIVKFFDKHLLF